MHVPIPWDGLDLRERVAARRRDDDPVRDRLRALFVVSDVSPSSARSAPEPVELAGELRSGSGCFWLFIRRLAHRLAGANDRQSAPELDCSGNRRCRNRRLVHSIERPNPTRPYSHRSSSCWHASAYKFRFPPGGPPRPKSAASTWAHSFGMMSMLGAVGGIFFTY